ncbi:unnamed protein product, partial [Ectocarpus sp. 13 AM-2016]
VIPSASTKHTHPAYVKCRGLLCAIICVCDLFGLFLVLVNFQFTPLFMAAQCCKKSCKLYLQLFFQTLSMELLMHALYETKRTFVRGAGGMRRLDFFFFTTERTTRLFHVAPSKKKRLKSVRESVV